MTITREQITREWLKERAYRYCCAAGKLGRKNIRSAAFRAMQSAGFDDDESADLLEQFDAEVHAIWEQEGK